MLQGVKSIITRLTEGDEFGIYRVGEDRREYFLFVCGGEEEAINLGRKLAKMLNRSFVNKFGEKRKKKSFSSGFVRRRS